MADDAKRTRDAERMREIRERMEEIQREASAGSEPEPPAGPGSPVQPGRSGRLRALLRLLGLVLAIVVTFQIAATLLSHNGQNFDDARRVGQATVESCERRGPVGFIYGYWDECLVRIQWQDGVPDRRYFDKPHLFDAREVGQTVEIGDNGYGRSGPRFSRPDFEPRPLLATAGIVLFVIAAIPALLVVWLLWSLLRDLIARPFRRH